MHRLVVLACLWRQAAPALQYHVAIDGSHATIAYDAGLWYQDLLGANRRKAA